ncbi:hypothetical protein O6H91_13G039600 [Diphasiastrum complanatum]|uniref:Uncharacterized protein n=1 Tax=Diphasiastrum complanatum TaxID=34168 RepID=A0ACC2BV45_DIPCM|nr:hypothetical protein O6H91_13G039600 [Diphasiastrum complanatum]
MAEHGSSACSHPSERKYKIALCQLFVSKNKLENIRHARELLEAAADGGAKLILLPEMWNCPYSNELFSLFAEEIDADDLSGSPSCGMLAEVSRSRKVTLVGGSIPERFGSHLYSTCCVFGSNGKLRARHRKVHLFDVDIPGQLTFKESATLTAGDELTIVDTDVGLLGIGICHDIRFPELAILCAERGADVICYLAAFEMNTGPLFWEVLQKARALDNQLYVATCSPARDLTINHAAWGHSTVVGPFGEILATTGHEEAVVFADIDYAYIREVRWVFLNGFCYGSPTKDPSWSRLNLASGS